jgi:carbamoyl-phosphate synthase large subunit
MPIKKVLVIGSGPIVIGQGCEFDYSGSQACQALREEGCEVILLNSNPATIMTDPESADHVYIEPMTVQTVEKIIAYHQIDALLPTMGGQTALNLAKKAQGLLQKYGVKLIGASLETIEKAENRQLFKQEMERIGLEVPLSFYASSFEQVQREKLEFPLVVRSSYNLGGKGGGIAHYFSELKEICENAFSQSLGVLIEQALFNWKEFELEVMRDSKGNCIVVCGIENIDPMGIHTGDSITVAPIQTLTDKEYQKMRKNAFQVMEAIGMTSGGCNVQFAVHPQSGQMVCIEVNPRVSRSSALASKATGYPIAKIAAKLALGRLLSELKAGHLPASFEPVIDYVAVKMPRFDFDKFKTADHQLTTRMKSTGETMALGRTFKEAWNKAIVSLESQNPIRQQTGWDPWFLDQILQLEEEEIHNLDREKLLSLKKLGFTDASIASRLKCREEEIEEKRSAWGIHPVYKQIDSCSGEFPGALPCLYSTYEEECEWTPAKKPSVLVLGSGPNRIGQGIEFDYACVHALKAIKSLDYEAVMLNSNPETVSTDYDRCGRLYFEPLTLEHVLEVIRKEKPVGVMIQFGGQTALNLGKQLHDKGVAILGTPIASIDITEDRNKFRSFLQKLNLKYPKNRRKFPLIIRPSYVTGGSAMQIISTKKELSDYLKKASGPVLIEEFLEGAKEVEVDAISDGKEVFICGIMEHIEPAGIHSGDSKAFLFPYSLSQDIQNQLIDQTAKIGLTLQVSGLFNVQFAIQDGQIFVLEANLRSSRTVPLLAKTTGLPLVQIAAKCLLGGSLQGLKSIQKLGLKLPVFSHSSLGLKEASLGPQMQSTGEVLCLGDTLEALFEKAEIYNSTHS